MLYSLDGYRKLANGRCPVHGTPLIQHSVVWEEEEPVGDYLSCSNRSCKYHDDPIPVKKGTALYRRIFKED